MDFSALLAKEIAKKKTAVVATSEKDKDEPSAGKRYLRRGDLEREREQKYLQEKAEREEAKRLEHEKRIREQKEEEQRREAKLREAERQYLEKKRAREEQEEQERLAKKKKKTKAISRSATPEDGTPEASEMAKLALLTQDEVVERLRKLKEPARLFGETDKARLRRLRKAEKVAENSDERIEELLASIDYNIVLNDIKNNPSVVYLQMEKYIRYLLQEWERVLVVRDDTPEQAFTTLEQNKEYLRPLLAQLRSKSLHAQIYPSLATILMSLQQRKYRDANDAYIKLSIGNAAWPIGVIAVGIHERSSGERITGLDNDGKPYVQIAHVMSNEKTRKWLTAIKRLITFAEGQWRE